MLYHLQWDGSQVLPHGWVGVDLFFVLSGFLITGILLDGKGRPGQMKRFYMRRVLRIFPLYYAVLALMFFVVPLFTDDPGIVYPAEDKPYFFLYVQNLFLPLIEPGKDSTVYLSHTWSLAIEEQFYLLWPWLVVFLPRRALVAILIALLVSTPLARFHVISDRPGYWYSYWFVYKNTFLHSDGLATGALLALAVRAPWISRGAVRWTSLLFAATFLPFTLWVLKQFGENAHSPYDPTAPMVGTLMYTGLALGFAGVLGASLTVPSRAVDLLLTNPVMLWTGRLSYGIYVYHFPVILAIRERGMHPAVSLVVTALVAAASWRFLESPFLRLKDRFSARPADSARDAVRTTP